MWCRPYITLNASYCFILDDGTGTAVGYILCAPDTQLFVERFRDEFLGVVKQAGIQEPAESNVASDNDMATQFRHDVYHPENMLQAEYPRLLEEYPAHLHIDILESHQSQRWGEKMIETLLEKLRGKGVRGVHLGMDANNSRAGKFYDRLGFEPFEGMNEQGEVGRIGGAIYRVKRVE